ncbi:MAG: mannitol dehydrogenase family protein [Treponema sp.]|jgi:fructuronate reductase|nr:mannitol dehydrogenase family protein [Treponema sp.]
MKLNSAELSKKEQWEKAGILLPQFDRNAMIAETKRAPEWAHFGAGNIFRIFPAALQQSLLERGLARTGVIVAEGYDGEIIDKAFSPCDNLTLAVTLKADGNIEKRVIGSVAQALNLEKPDQFSVLQTIFRSPSLKMASFTITEKGYSLNSREGGFSPDVQADFDSCGAASYMGKVSALLLERYKAGAFPIAMVSMDNCSHNGDKLFAAISAFADQWAAKGFIDKGFADYVRDRAKVAFPWSMIDKITPRPDEGVRKMLEESGFEDTAGRITTKQTYIAPFVNAEETQYLVIEDSFPNGRPPLEKAGVLFATRETVDKVEKMKVCTCLNPLHTSLAVFGCLLGYTKISDEMKDADLVALIEGVGYKEGLPVAVDPGVLSPKAFIDQVVRARLPNPFMPDTPQRIACDTSQKIPIRFGETIKAYLASETLNVEDLRLIPLTLAAWARYLLGIDDTGAAFTVSPDPLYESLFAHVKHIKLGDVGDFHGALQPIFSDASIFAVNLYDAGLGARVEGLFAEMAAGVGAVRNTLRKYTAESARSSASGL